MSTRSKAGKFAGNHQDRMSTDPDSPDGCGAPPAESGPEGPQGAPPSNTAPDNCNFTYQPLRWGIDSLYLSYPGELSGDRGAELKELKRIAQGASFEVMSAQMELAGHIFEVRDKSSGLFAFTLVDDAYMIRLSNGKAKKLPMAYVQVSSRLLSHKPIKIILEELRAIMAALGEVESPKVSRVDLFLDFASNLDMEGWRRNAWVTHARDVAQYAQDEDFTGWSIGSHKTFLGRLYQKVLESRISGKEYLHDLWRQVGWDGETPVWRMEFEFPREALAQLGLSSPYSISEHLAGMWSYATTDWLRLCIPSVADKTRSRWPEHPLWLAISSVDWGTSGGPLKRDYKPTRAPSMEYLGTRLASLIASIGAVVNITDFDLAAAEAKKQAYDAMALQNGLSGISVDQLYMEKVQLLTREYNLRMNPKPKPKPKTPTVVDNEYKRQSQGH